jgi:hypothetical protein
VHVRAAASIADPGLFRIPKPGSASNNLSIFNPKTDIKFLKNKTRDVHPGTLTLDLDFFPKKHRAKKHRIPGLQHWLQQDLFTASSRKYM